MEVAREPYWDERPQLSVNEEVSMMHRTLSLAVAATLCAAVPAMAHPGSAIVVDRLGQIWFLDTGDGLWKIDTHGALIRIGGSRFHWMALDQDNLFAKTPLPRDVARVGTSPTLLIASDYPVAIGRDGNLYYPSVGPGGRVQIMRAQPSGQTSVLAVLPATTAGGDPLKWLNGLTGGADGALYFTENSSIRRVSMQGQITTVATNLRVDGCVSIPGNAPSDGLLLRGLSVDAAGVIYVAASGCGSALRISPDGRVTKLAQLESPWSPTAVALFGSDVYVLEYLHTEVEDRRAWVPRVRKISADGSSIVIAKVERK
jgi:sugar lactone lactonase YvrE